MSTIRRLSSHALDNSPRRASDKSLRGLQKLDNESHVQPHVVRRAATEGEHLSPRRSSAPPTVAKSKSFPRRKSIDPPSPSHGGRASAVSLSTNSGSKGRSDVTSATSGEDGAVIVAPPPNPGNEFRQNMVRRHVMSKAKNILAKRKKNTTEAEAEAEAEDDEPAPLALADVLQAVVQGTKETMLTEKILTTFAMTPEERNLRDEIKSRARETLKTGNLESLPRELAKLEESCEERAARFNGLVNFQHVRAELESIRGVCCCEGEHSRRASELLRAIKASDVNNQKSAIEKCSLLDECQAAFMLAERSGKELWDVLLPVVAPQATSDAADENLVQQLGKLPEATLEHLKTSIILSCDSVTAEIFKEECTTIISELGAVAEDIPKIVEGFATMGWRDYVNSALAALEEKTQDTVQAIGQMKSQLELQFPDMHTYEESEIDEDVSQKSSRQSTKNSTCSSALAEMNLQVLGRTMQSTGRASSRSVRSSTSKMTASSRRAPRMSTRDSLPPRFSSHGSSFREDGSRVTPCSPLSSLVAESLNGTVQDLFHLTGSVRSETLHSNKWLHRAKTREDQRIEENQCQSDTSAEMVFEESEEIVHDARSEKVENEEHDQEEFHITGRTAVSENRILHDALSLAGGWPIGWYAHSPPDDQRGVEAKATITRSYVESTPNLLHANNKEVESQYGEEMEDIPETFEDEVFRFSQLPKVGLSQTESPSLALKIALTCLRRHVVGIWGSVREAAESMARQSRLDENLIKTTTFVDALQDSGHACTYGEICALLQALSIDCCYEGVSGVLSKQDFMRLANLEAHCGHDDDDDASANIKQAYDAFRKHQFHRLLVESLSAPEQIIAEMHAAGRDGPILEAILDKCFEELSGTNMVEFAECVLSKRGIVVLVEIIIAQDISADLRVKVVSVMTQALGVVGRSSFGTSLADDSRVAAQCRVSNNWLASYRALSDAAQADRHRQSTTIVNDNASSRMRIPTPPAMAIDSGPNDFQMFLAKFVWRPILEFIDPDTESTVPLDAMLFVELLALLQQLQIAFVLAGPSGAHIIPQVSAVLHRLQGNDRSRSDIRKLLSALDNLCACVPQHIVHRVAAALGGRRLLRERILTIRKDASDMELGEHARTFLIGFESERKRINLRWPMPVAKPLERAKFDAVLKAKENVAATNIVDHEDVLDQSVQKPSMPVSPAPPRTASLQPSPFTQLQGWSTGYEKNLISWMNGKTASVHAKRGHLANRVTKSCKFPRIIMKPL